MSYGVLECDIGMLQNSMLMISVIKDFVIKTRGIICARPCITKSYVILWQFCSHQADPHLKTLKYNTFELISFPDLRFFYLESVFYAAVALNILNYFPAPEYTILLHFLLYQSATFPLYFTSPIILCNFLQLHFSLHFNAVCQ